LTRFCSFQIACEKNRVAANVYAAIGPLKKHAVFRASKKTLFVITLSRCFYGVFTLPAVPSLLASVHGQEIHGGVEVMHDQIYEKGFKRA